MRLRLLMNVRNIRRSRLGQRMKLLHKCWMDSCNTSSCLRLLLMILDRWNGRHRRYYGHCRCGTRRHCWHRHGCITSHQGWSGDRDRTLRRYQTSFWNSNSNSSSRIRRLHGTATGIQEGPANANTTGILVEVMLHLNLGCPSLLLLYRQGLVLEGRCCYSGNWMWRHISSRYWSHPLLRMLLDHLRQEELRQLMSLLTLQVFIADPSGSTGLGTREAYLLLIRHALPSLFSISKCDEFECV